MTRAAATRYRAQLSSFILASVDFCRVLFRGVDVGYP